ncbi:MAG: TonB-dependent receptor plug domain-containing protein [Gemmatimonas sp.]|nr:TonB-dependent receptor plug domain-containing protein [Gemmatimonas sp.]
MPFRLFLHGLLAVLAAAVTTIPAAAQSGTVSGVVRSAETGVPLISAVVQLTGPDGGRYGSTLSNQSGSFRIFDVPVGSYEVTARTTGYEAGRLEVTVTAGQASEAEFSLVPRAIDLDPVVISASRREERALDAPARVEVVGPGQIAERPAVQPTDHLRSLAGVDIVTQGLQSTNVVARGFNNAFSGALLTLTDHRIASVPSLRLNALHLVPATNEDIERVEVVLGPGSALYGPNTANGVAHIFTRSPLTYQGTTLAMTGGTRDVFQGSGRTAYLLNDNFGFKLSGMYFRGEEWPYTDPAEVSAREEADPSDPFYDRIGVRDFDAERWSLEGRADWRITPDATAILSAGRSTNVRGLELTGLGTSQADQFSYTYVQGRFNSGGLFAQAYANFSDSGDTFLLRTGAPTIDHSKFYVGQVQHAVSPTNWQDFTYGVDYLHTVPETDGTIHGRFEDEDDYTEIGAFLQSETTFSNRFDVILAGRVDRHSVIDKAVFSPRAALVFRPDETQSLRFSYNRAYSNPGSVQLFLDLEAGPASEALGPLGYTIRAEGTGRDGISFQTDDGQFVMRSPFTADRTELQAINVENLWAMQLLGIAGALVQQGDFTRDQAAAFLQFMTPQVPTGADIWGINPVTGMPAPFVPPQDVPGIRESNTATYEVGYNGILGGRLQLAADVWYAQKNDFISPLIPQAPLVQLNPAEVIDHSTPLIEQALIGGGVPPEAAGPLAQEIAEGLASIPGGVVYPPDIPGGAADLVVSYRNFGDINLWGGDISATALLGDWTLGLSGSLVSDDHFTTEGQIVTLNAPKRKGSAWLGYRNEGLGFNGEARVRHLGGFPVNSGVYIGILCIEPEAQSSETCVEASTLVDLTLGYQIGPLPGASLQLTVQNLFDSDYRSFVGVPDIGRLALLRLKYEF